MVLRGEIVSQISSSRDIAKDRLSKVLMQDRACFSPELLEELRAGLINQVKKYAEIDEVMASVRLEQQGGKSTLLVSIPVLSVHKLIPVEEPEDVF